MEYICNVCKYNNSDFKMLKWFYYYYYFNLLGLI